MSFDWRDYLNLAQALQDGNDEASLRSAISRAYYAAYHVCRTHLANDGFVIRAGDGQSHAGVWQELSARARNQGGTYAAASRHGDSLKKARVAADYEAGTPVTKQAAKSAVSTARACINAVDSGKRRALN